MYNIILNLKTLDLVNDFEQDGMDNCIGNFLVEIRNCKLKD